MGTVLHRCRIRLKKEEERLLLRGDPRVRKRQIEGLDGNFSAGCVAGVYDFRGNCLGAGYANLNSPIPFRLLRCTPGDVDTRLIRHRLEEALDFRLRMFAAEDSFRLVYGEADWLPGLVVDKYGPYLCLQVTTLAMEMRLDSVLRVLEDLLSPEAIVLRNDTVDRQLEDLPLHVRVVRGQAPRQVEFPVDGLMLSGDLVGGEKTGFFLDQRENRRDTAAICRDKLVLDACCYSGSFSVLAARAGASHVTGIDTSDSALKLAETNARRHGMTDRCSFLREDVFVFLRNCASEGMAFEVIFLDPPSLIQSRQTLERDTSAYRRLNRLALECLAPGGTLVTSSCSHLLSPRLFFEELGTAIRASSRDVSLYRLTGASPDHPILPAMLETQYLKCAFLASRGAGLNHEQ